MSARRRSALPLVLLVAISVPALLSGCGGSGTAAAAPGASGTPTASTTAPSAGPSAAGTASGSPVTTATGSPVPEPSGSPVPPPEGEVRAPWDRAGSDFGFVTGVRRSAGGGATITFDRAQWLTGAEYDEYVDRSGTPENDYVILNESRQVRRIELDASVLLQGSSLAGQDGSDSARMTLDEFVTAANAAVSGGPVPVWLFHATSDLSSPVTGLQEQYLP